MQITTLPADDPKDIKLGWVIYGGKEGMPEETRAAFEEYETTIANPQWERFMGNNHEQIKLAVRGCVAFSAKEHLGKPLSTALWGVLVGGIGVTNIRIYKPMEGHWCDGRHNAATIMLDEQDIVRDIIIYP